MALPNIRKLLLLGLLKNSDMHGYHLNSHLESNIPIQIKKPTAYNLLARMEEDEWILHKSEFTGNRERKIYSLTTKGNEVFESMLEEELSTFNLQEYPGLVGIWLLEKVPEMERNKLLQKRKTAIQNYIEIYKEHTQDKESITNSHEGSSGLVLDFIRRSLDLELEFLVEIITINKANIKGE